MVNKTWDEVLGKPENLVPAMHCAARLIAAAKAKEQGLLTRKDTLKALKTAVQEVILDQLHAIVLTDESDVPTPSTDANIIADAFWDEIIGTDPTWIDNTERISAMIEAIYNSMPLTKQSSIGDTKSFVNENILKPLKGIKDATDSE